MHASRISRTQSAIIGRAFGPLSPPAIIQSIPDRSSIASGPRSGSKLKNRVRAPVARRSSTQRSQWSLIFYAHAHPHINRPIEFRTKLAQSICAFCQNLVCVLRGITHDREERTEYIRAVSFHETSPTCCSRRSGGPSTKDLGSPSDALSKTIFPVHFARPPENASCARILLLSHSVQPSRHSHGVTVGASRRQDRTTGDRIPMSPLSIQSLNQVPFAFYAFDFGGKIATTSSANVPAFLVRPTVINALPSNSSKVNRPGFAGGYFVFSHVATAVSATLA